MQTFTFGLRVERTCALCGVVSAVHESVWRVSRVVLLFGQWRAFVLWEA